MMTPKVRICKAFNQQAFAYEKEARAQHEIGQRLFARLDYIKLNPRYILDLGAGHGGFSSLLKKKYPKAEIVGLDLARNMLEASRLKQGFWRRWHLVNADMQALPFAAGLFDLVFANQVIHWSLDRKGLFQELMRVMNPGACFMFSTLGPDTFKELRMAWSCADNHSHVNDFADMHEFGDALLQALMLDPVVDMEYLTLTYADLGSLIRTLKAQGVINIHQGKNLGLTGKQAWQNFSKAYASFSTAEGKYPLTYEVIYGHAWKGSMQRGSQGVETFIPVTSISHSRK